MKLSRLVSFFALALATLLPATLAAQVKATLVADVTSVQPGQPFTAAVRLVHDGHWHTYWINPGTGLATTPQLDAAHRRDRQRHPLARPQAHQGRRRHRHGQRL
jgi:DsbC/DsbD-like thiol-disulfide interchange protein